ncbi:MAG: RluA family pseudouridine synthase [Acidimicrobiia bacterium]|nr:RluA family pseudouridine synthase [Acidimicrobiia bacterium]
MADEVVTRIPTELDGQRADKAISVILGVSRSVARTLVDGGATLDGVPMKAADRVSAGAVLKTLSPPSSDELEPQPIEFDVLYEDEHLAVIDKPAGLVVHPGAGTGSDTLAAGLLYQYPDIHGVGDSGRWGIVHRLDRDTSGAMIVARSADAYTSLKAMIERREVERVYDSLVDGEFSAPTGTIDAPIARDLDRPRRRAVMAEGKRAVTHYQVIRTFTNENCSLVAAKLETGRTHQIRVHFAAIGHPVIGDKTYGKKTTRAQSPRQFLHARTIGFRHPVTGEAMNLEAPLPADLQAVIAKLSSG